MSPPHHCRPKLSDRCVVSLADWHQWKSLLESGLFPSSDAWTSWKQFKSSMCKTYLLDPACLHNREWISTQPQSQSHPKWTARSRSKPSSTIFLLMNPVSRNSDAPQCNTTCSPKDGAEKAEGQPKDHPVERWWLLLMALNEQRVFCLFLQIPVMLPSLTVIAVLQGLVRCTRA